MKGQSFQFSDAKDLGEIPTGSPPTAIFDQYLAYLTNGAK